MEGPGADPLPTSLAAGNERAFAALYDRFGQRLYRAAMGMLGRREDAEDTVQEVFAAVFQSRRRLSESQDIWDHTPFAHHPKNTANTLFSA